LIAALAGSVDSKPAPTQSVRDLADLRNFITGAALTVPVDILWAPMFAAALFILHPLYGYYTGACAVVMLMLSALTDLLTRQPLVEANRSMIRSLGEVHATARNAEAIEAMGMLAAVARSWQVSFENALGVQDRADRRARLLASLSKTLRVLLGSGTISIGAYLVVNHYASPGSMMAANVLVVRAFSPFDRLIGGWRSWMLAWTAFRRLRATLEIQETCRTVRARPSTETGQSIGLVVKNLVYQAPGNARTVIDGISFALERGKVLGIVGSSGAGKSTLVRLLVGVIAPTQGCIEFNGTGTYGWERESFGRVVGYLPQGVHLLDGSVRDNIARMGEVDDAEVIAAARLADVHDMIGRLPRGYDTIVGDGAYSLSGGQRQRIALARALYGNPSLIVLDEPDANLDHVGNAALARAIQKAKQAGATVVVISHKPSLLSVVDTLMVLKAGRIEQFGPCTEVLQAMGDAAPATGNITRVVSRGQAEPARIAQSLLQS
jgi:ATP-binding cassette subfamily C protein